MAALLHDPALVDEPELLAAVGAAAGIALENGRLQAEQQAHLEELKGSRARVIEAGQKERQRLERNLHDGAQQRLIALSLELSLLEKQLADDPDAGDAARRARSARSPSRSTSYARWRAASIRPCSAGTGSTVALETIAAQLADPGAADRRRSKGRLPEQIEVAAYYVVSESLANIGKHARATSASVDVTRDGRRPWSSRSSTTASAAPTPSAASGLRGLADRVEALRRPLARLEPGGGGTRLRAEMPCAVAIAEDSVLLREGLARLLDEAGFEVVAQCETGDDLLLKVRSYSPDVAIVDIRLPPTHNDEGLRAALEIRAQHPSVGVLVLSQYVELGLALKLLADSAEGVGYLLKDRISDVDEFVAAVRRVADGGSALDPIIVSTLLSRQRPDDPLAQLTAREREVLELMATGSSNQGIADKLVITRAGGREVRLQHLRQARPAVDRERVAARARGADVPALLTRKRPARHQKPGPLERASRPVFRRSPAAARLSRVPQPPQGAVMKTRIIQNEPEEPASGVETVDATAGEPKRPDEPGGPDGSLEREPQEDRDLRLARVHRRRVHDRQRGRHRRSSTRTRAGTGESGHIDSGARRRVQAGSGRLRS